MHHIAFITYPGFELLDLSGPASVLNGANRAMSQRGKPQFYRIVVASAKGGMVASSSGVTVDTVAVEELLTAGTQTMLIVGGEREPLLSAMADTELLAAISCLVPRAERYGSICSGGFLLAAIGLFDGHRVATHWDSCAPLASAFPKAVVDSDSLYVIDGRLWTSAGMTTGIDMTLAMVAHDIEAAIAGEVAKRMVLYARRPGYQSQFSPVLQAQVKGSSPFGDLIGWMQANLATSLDVPSLARRAGMTERTFHRKFVTATGETPARFVEIARLDAARMLLSRGLSLKSVAAQVGLSPPARLAEAFERRFGITPRLFRDMHASLQSEGRASAG